MKQSTENIFAIKNIFQYGKDNARDTFLNLPLTNIIILGISIIILLGIIIES